MNNPFARLVELSRSNDRLVLDLAKARRRLGQALDYESDPRSRPEVGSALVMLAQKKHAALLQRLRSNRFEALEILAQGSLGGAARSRSVATAHRS